MKRFLQCRNVGLCMCQNRLMGYRVVRSTVPTLFLWPQFTVDPAARMARSEEHLGKNKQYPDKYYYLNEVQKYLFRNEQLRYLRTHQFFRYFSHSSETATGKATTLLTSENTMSVVEADIRVPDDPTHRNYDERVSAVAAGDKFPCARLRIFSDTAVRRQNSNFQVPRSAFLEPLGGGREDFYEQRLLFGLPWHCLEKPTFEGEPPHAKSRWTYCTEAPHTPPELRSFTMLDRAVEGNKTMEELCIAFESTYAAQDKCCACCDIASTQCTTCSHAWGWHTCEKDIAALGVDQGGDVTAEPRWRKGTLHNGRLDMDNTMWTLARRLVPLAVLKEKLATYVEEGHLEEEKVDEYVEVFERMQGVVREQNVFADPMASAIATEDANRPMSMVELQAELASRETLMQSLHEQEGAWTDQWRVYTEVVEALTANTEALRMFLQASAGTGKSFLLETLYLWCVVNGFKPEACAPTGIAAARLRVPRTPVQAFTLHYLFALNIELESKIDPSKPQDEKTQRLRKMTVLFADEVSMIDGPTWWSMKDQLTTVAETPLQEPGFKPHPAKDEFGGAHVLLVGDYKQLPPATSQPPLIAADSAIVEKFRFRMLRQNRRLVSSSDPAQQCRQEEFHTILEDIAHGRASQQARMFLVESYVRGANKNQSNVGFEESTACFTTRRYRDAWNRKVLERSAKKHEHALRVKAVFATRGTESQWIREEAANAIRRTVRSQCLVNLRLAGQWLDDPPRAGEVRPHCMRAMLVANMDVPNSFANGTGGRVVQWGPEADVAGVKSRVVLANVPGVQARFYTEAAWVSQKKHFLPGIDFMDLEPRRETVATARGKPTMMQLTLQPSYGLTIHKVQSATIRITVQGCLEGVFALGQVYVLSSRVTDPAHFQLVGLPPEDLLEEVALAWKQAGHDVDVCFAMAAAVTSEWEYTPAGPRQDPCAMVRARLKPTGEEKRRVPLRLKALADVLNPQPAAAEVFHGLLNWIDRCDQASQAQQPPPPAARADGAPLFPEHKWWLTELEQRRPAGPDANMEDEVPYDEEELTHKPEEALWHSDGSESGSSGEEQSDGSLPAGPRFRAAKACAPAATQRRQGASANQTGSSTQRGAGAPQKRASASSCGLPAVPALKRRLRGKQSPGVHGPAPEPLAGPLPGQPALAGQEVFLLSSSSVAAAPAWMRRSAKAGDSSIQVRDDGEPAIHESVRVRSAAELLAAMRQGFLRQP